MQNENLDNGNQRGVVGFSLKQAPPSERKTVRIKKELVAPKTNTKIDSYFARMVALKSEAAEVEIYSDTGISEPVVHASMCCSKYTACMASAGTLENGKVYVGISRLSADFPMLGLFAGQNIEEKEVVCEYGGVLRWAVDARKFAPDMHSHTRSIPGSAYIRDGLPWSNRFDRSPAVMARVLEEEGAHINGVELRADGKAQGLMPSLAEPHVYQRIVQEGCGYMANTGAKHQHNIRIDDVQVCRGGVYPSKLFFVATRPLAAHTEIISPYNNELQKLLQKMASGSATPSTSVLTTPAVTPSKSASIASVPSKKVSQKQQLGQTPKSGRTLQF